MGKLVKNLSLKSIVNAIPKEYWILNGKNDIKNWCRHSVSIYGMFNVGCGRNFICGIAQIRNYIAIVVNSLEPREMILILMLNICNFTS